MYRAVGWSRPCPYPGSGAITGHRAASSIATSVAPAEMWSARFEVRLTGATRNARPASTSTAPPPADATAAMADSSAPVSSLIGPLYKGSVWSMSTNSVKILRAKSAGFSNLRYSRIESTSADCSARLACDIDAEEERVTQQAGIPGEVENLD